jgi:hypothetical protein
VEEQMARRRRAKINIPIVLACVLLFLTMLSVHFSSGIFARYVSRADGQDNAKVASFGNLTITESGDFFTGSAIVLPGVDLTKRATVSYEKGEVAVFIIFEAELSDHWTTADNNFVIKNESTGTGEDTNFLSWSVTNDWTFIEESGEGNRFAYYIALEPNESLAPTDFVANDGKVTVSKYITAEDLEEMKKIGDIYINFKAYAVQAGDMTALEAWNKVK